MTNAEWFQRLLAVEAPDPTWHPEDFPIVIEQGKDSIIWDVEGNAFIDMVAGFGALPLGHNNDAVQEKLKSDENFLIQGLGDVYPSRFKIQFIEKLLSFLPSYLNRAILSVTGSQAVETAMKTAMLSTGGKGFISFQNAYHGLDLGCLALTGHPHFRSSFQSWLNRDYVQHLPFSCDLERIREAMQTFKNKGIRPAGIIVEPIQGRGGFRAAGLDWLKALKKIAEEESCLLIFDEIFLGFGRAGKVSFAEDVPCDLLCLGKTIGGGMPLSACVGSEKFMNAWPLNYGEAIHTGTFFGHPYSARVGLATLELIKDLNLVHRSQELGAKFLQKLKQSLAQNPLIRDLRGNGLMIAIEFVNFEHSLTVMKELRKEGVFLIPCGPKGECVSLTPALNIEEKLLDSVLTSLIKVIRDLEKKS